MPPGAHDTLATLRDLPGVTGSFVVSARGELCAMDMPAYFDAEALAEVGPRAVRMLETWSALALGDECLMRFEEHRLYLRVIEGGLLCVLLASAVHMPSMRTAAGMVARRLSSAPPPPPPPLDTQPAPRAGRKRVRVWRGQRFEY